LSSAAEPLWESLSAPVKAAIRWGWASACARSSSEVDSIDLLVGIMLADLKSSPARVLLDHFGIPLGEVVARRDSASPTAKALLAATGWQPGLPALDVGAGQIISSSPVNDFAVHDDGPVPLRNLFHGLLESINPAGKAIRDALTARGVDPVAVTEAHRGFLTSRQPLDEYLADVFPYRTPRVALPDYLADQPDQPTDLVGIGAEVDAFAHLIAARRLVPPLAVGMFGDWGSGKSYFLRSLQNRITQISTARLHGFHQSIVQVEFNAWQYVGGDLWASLIEHLFRNLRRSTDESDGLVAERQRHWIQQVRTAGEAHQKAMAERLNLARKHKTAAAEVDDRTQDLRVATVKLDDALKPDPSAALKHAVREAAKTAGFAEVIDNATALATELDQARTDLRSLLTPLRDRKRLTFVLVALVLAPVIAYLTKQIDLSAVSTVAWLLGTAATYVATAGQFIRTTSKRIAEARAELAQAEAEERRRVEKQVDEAQASLDAVRSRLTAAVEKEQELAARFAEVKRKQEAETPGRVLTDFITDRVDSDDYRRHLGVPALVRRDLAELTRLVAKQTTEKLAIDRIVLYIDDLDRCPTPVVIKVLEAVHLLLAFRLFVVVVAVDARWLTSSLKEHFRQLDGPDATPEDYLEKIFQVPFRIQPLRRQVREQMLRGLLTPSLTSGGERFTRVARGEDNGPPETDKEEFEAVVASFATAAGGRQALSDAIDLTITSAELAQAQDVAELIGSTPRAVKRFANVYLLVKSIGAGRGWELPENGQLVILLAIAIGLPRLADVLFPRLTKPGTLTGAVPTPSEMDPWHGQYTVLRDWVSGDSKRDVLVAEITGWLDLIDRFRLPGARAGGDPGRMDG
jgi:KAP-like P-loop domain-containing protein